MAFYIFTFGWSWAFWIAAALLQAGTRAPLGRSLLIAGLLGPALAGITLVLRDRDPAMRRDYWRRLIDPGRIPALQWLVALFLVPALATAALVLAHATPLSPPTDPWQLARFLMGLLILGPLPEEPGWRGYALDRLQARYSPLQSALRLGLIWAVWHLPLFFVPDMVHSRHGLGSPWFWLFMVQVPCLSIVASWLFNNTRRSTLAAIVLHFSANLSLTLGNVTPGTNLWITVLLIAVCLVLSRGLKVRP